MSGININVVPRTLYKFDSVIANSTVFSFPIARYIDVSRYREVNGVLRVHTRSLLGTGTPKITVSLLPDAPTAQDPAQDFIGLTNQQGSGAAFDIVNATAAPSAVLLLPTAIGPMLSVWLSVTAGTSTAALQATISVDINMKS